MRSFVDPESLPSFEDWRATIDRDLKGAPYQRLETRLHEGLTIAPLYTGAPIEPGGVGAPHYRRGLSTDTWEVRQRYDLPQIEDVREAIDDDLSHGVEAVHLVLDRAARLGTAFDRNDLGLDGVSIQSAYELARALGTTPLDGATLTLDVGANGTAALGMLLAVARRARLEPRQLCATLSHDPCGALAQDGALPSTLDNAWDDAAALAQWTRESAPAVRPLGVSTTAIHEAGGHAVTELAFAIGSGVATFRALEARGVPLRDIAAATSATVAIGSDLFLEAAKLRALRVLWSYALEAMGLGPEHRGLAIHAVTAARGLTVVDPWVNLLRTSTQTFSAIIGGASSIATRPFDSLHGVPDALGRRMARNAQLLLRDEAMLGDVTDPGGGAWYLEALTDALTEHAWAAFQDLERRGGLPACLADGSVQAKVAESRTLLERDVATRRRPLTGATEFADPTEALPTRPARRPDGFLDRRRAALDAEGRGPQVAATLERLPGGSLDAVLDAYAAGATIRAVQVARQLAAPVTVAPLAPMRHAEAFEALRAAVLPSAATVHCVAIGALPAVSARGTWAANALASAGLVSTPLDPAPTLDAAFGQLGGDAADAPVLLVMPDAAFSDTLVPAIQRARAAGASCVLVAGHPQNAPQNACPDAWLHLGVDLHAALTPIVRLLEARA